MVETHTTRGVPLTTRSPSLTSFLRTLQGMGATTEEAASRRPSAFSYQAGSARARRRPSPWRCSSAASRCPSAWR